MRMRRTILFGIVLVALVVISAAASRLIRELNKPVSDIPTARVSRGPLKMDVYATGELRPTRSAMLVAPPVGGGQLQIIHMARTGARVNEGDIVVEFDPAEQEFNLEQNRSQLEEADQQLVKTKADISVRVAQDNVALLRARFDVRRAELTVGGNELLSAIEARKNVLNLEESRRRLQQLEMDIKSRASSDQADLALLAVKRSQAMLAMKMAQQNIDAMKLRAPISGIMVPGQNMDSLMSGGIVMLSSSMDYPVYREGDQASPGRTMGQIQDIDTMEIMSQVTETDRGGLDSGQAVEVTVDAMPWMRFGGRIKSLADVASVSTQSIVDRLSSSRVFSATFDFDCKGIEISPGVSTRLVISGTNVADALSLPRQALFTKEGKPVVYVKNNEEWDVRDIQVKYLTESRVVIEGLEEGAEVALTDPHLQQDKDSRKSGVLGSILGAVGQ